MVMENRPVDWQHPGESPTYIHEDKTQNTRERFFVKLSINNHIVDLVHEIHTIHPEVRGTVLVYVRVRTTATAVPDCNTSSGSSVASRRWSKVLAPQRVNPALAVAVAGCFTRQQ